MTLPFPTSDTTSLRERLRALRAKCEAAMERLDWQLSQMERYGSDDGSYWNERKLDEISRELERWEGRT
ncbi:MAG: hypothetical protein ACYTBJ_20770 [Planctomycetota bacterium]|jgi:hypothetical protein